MSKSDSDSSAVYNILAFVLDGKDSAQEAVKEIKSSGSLDGYSIVAECTVEQDEKGKVHFQEPGKGGAGATIGAVAGGLLALIGGPVGVLAMVVGGGVIGGVAGKYLGRPIDPSDIKEFGETLTPDTSAFLLLLEDKYSESVVDGLPDYNAKVVTLTVGDELSGEIDQYVAGGVEEK